MLADALRELTDSVKVADITNTGRTSGQTACSRFQFQPTQDEECCSKAPPAVIVDS